METLPVNERYSYVFEGNSQTLDHILVSSALFGRPFAHDIVHLNSEFAVRVSDHDPQLARLCADATPPTLTLGVTPTLLWPPNHQYWKVCATGDAVDNVDPDVALSLVSVTSSEPDDAPGDQDGNTTNDIVIDSDTCFRLRAERSESTCHTIAYRATDACGNTSQASVTVTVPHDMGGLLDLRDELHAGPARRGER
jgi:hypothetical protein